MKKAHLSKWRQEAPGPYGGPPDDYKDYKCDDEDTESPAGEINLIKRQVSEITSSSDMDVLDLRTNVKDEEKVKEKPKTVERLEALDLRTNSKKGEDCSKTSTNGGNRALDLRISNIVSLNGVNPIPSCVPEFLSDCDMSNQESDQTQNSATSVDNEPTPTSGSESGTNNRNVEGMVTTNNGMLPLNIIEGFKLIRNLKVGEHGLIPSNTDDPGGTRLEVVQEEVVETSSDHSVPDVNMEHAVANGYNYIIQPIKIGAFSFISFC